MKRFVIIFIFVISFFKIDLVAQNGAYDLIGSNNTHKVSLSEIDKKQTNPLPKLYLTQDQRTKTLPLFVNNSHQIYFPWPFYQTGLECGQSTSIRQIFSYEICLKRGWTDINYNDDHKFPSHFVWNFCNDGINDGVLFLESWRIVKSAGTPSINDWGENLNIEQYTRWMTGYDKYYRAMQNRISEVCVIPTDTEEGILTLKHWLHNHLENHSVGGLANFNAKFKYPDSQIPSGFPGAGKTIITSFTNDPDHAYTIIGYNDTIGWDYNGDQQLTNNIDINNDGKVDVRDWEKGCFIITHTSGPEWGDFGQTYLPYKIMATDYHQNGIWATSAFVVKVKDEVKPQLTLKSSLSYNQRNNLKISVGVSQDTNATIPDFVYEPSIFQNQGGNYFMQGGNSLEHLQIEFGIDLSPLLNYIEPNLPAKFFYIIHEKDPLKTGFGSINQFSILDYSHDIPIEIENKSTPKTIIDNHTTSLSIIHTLNFSKPKIIDSTVYCTINEPINQVLHATDGIPEYRWEFTKEYNVAPISLSYPNGGSNILFNDIDEGYATIELPFRFPYFQDHFFKVNLFSNGYIAFSQQDVYPFVYEDITKLQTTKMIAPFLADLKILSAKKVLGTQSVTFTIKAKLKSQQNSDISFSVTLFQDGKITFQYGNLQYVGAPFYAAISNGDGDPIFYAPSQGKNDNDLRFTSFQFSPPLFIEGISLSNSGVLSGRLNKAETYDFWVTCYDNNDVKTSKKISIECTNPSDLTITHFDWNTDECSMIQRGSSEYIGFTVHNFSSVHRENTTLHYSIQNYHIYTNTNEIELGSFTPGETRNFQNGFSFYTHENTPVNEMVDIKWAILQNQDTISKGLFSFYIEDIDLDILSYNLKPSDEKSNQYHLNTTVYNIKNCDSKNLTFKLSIIGTPYKSIIAENSVNTIKGHDSESVHFVIDDPQNLLSGGDYLCQLSIYANDILIRKKEFTLYHDYTIIANPNPSSDYVEVSSSNPLIKINQIQIYNTQGILQLDQNINQNQILLDISSFKQGLYIMKIKSENSEIRTLKIIKIS